MGTFQLKAKIKMFTRQMGDWQIRNDANNYYQIQQKRYWAGQGRRQNWDVRLPMCIYSKGRVEEQTLEGS